MCPSKIPNASTAMPTNGAVAAANSDSRWVALKADSYASLWSSRRVRAAHLALNAAVVQRR